MQSAVCKRNISSEVLQLILGGTAPKKLLPWAKAKDLNLAQREFSRDTPNDDIRDKEDFKETLAVESNDRRANPSLGRDKVCCRISSEPSFCSNTCISALTKEHCTSALTNKSDVRIQFRLDVNDILLIQE